MLRHQRSTNIGLLIVKNPSLNTSNNKEDESPVPTRVSGVAKAQHKMGNDDKTDNFHVQSTSTTSTTSTNTISSPANQQNIQSQVYQELKQAKYLQRKAKRMRRINQSKAQIKKELGAPEFTLFDHKDVKEKESNFLAPSSTTTVTTTTATTSTAITSKLGYKWEHSEIFGEPGRSLLSKLTAKPQIEETEIDHWRNDLEKLYKPDTEANESNVNQEIEEIDAYFESLFQNAKSGLVYTAPTRHEDFDDDSFGSISFSESDNGYFQNFGNNGNNNSSSIYPNSNSIINNFSTNVVNSPNPSIKNNNISNLSGSAASTPQSKGNKLSERYQSYAVTNLDEMNNNNMNFNSPLQYSSDSETSDCELLEDSFDS
jgi:hypothetical protein